MGTEPIRVARVERADDLPVLLAVLRRLEIPALFDAHYPVRHWAGELTPGEVVCVWLAFILSEGDHRLCKVQPWAEANLRLLETSFDKPVRPLDFHDDRLADLLGALPRAWPDFEAALNASTLRVYDLKADLFRIDTTTASSHAPVLGEGGILRFGHSKGDPSRPQLKVAAAALDPLGLPVAVSVVPGDSADDPLYVPAIQAVRRSFGQGGKTYVGDCKMAALATRAFIARGGDLYLCPLSEKQMPKEERLSRLEAVWPGAQPLEAVHRPQEEGDTEPPERIAEGFRFDARLEEEEGGKHAWTERRWLVRSDAFAKAQKAALVKRLAKAEQDLAQLSRRGQGRKRLDAAGLGEAAAEAIRSNRAEGLLSAEVATRRTERRVRGYRGAAGRVEIQEEHSVEVKRDEEAIRRAEREMGWQVYATNREDWGLREVVMAYRGQYRIEEGWSRLKGKPLSLEPMHLADEGRMEGLVLLLALALRALGLLEWQVRQKLEGAKEELSGIYPWQPKRKTARPSAEMLLGAFKGICLAEVAAGGKHTFHMTPLNPLQVKLLALWELPPDLYQRIVLHCAEPPRAITER